MILDYFYGPYKNVPARIIAEKYMSEDENNTESSVLTDYKFFCFDGIPRIVYVSKDKADDPRTDFFDMDFKRLPIKMKDPNSDPDMIPQKPERFEEMKEYAAELAKGIKHLRVDFYQIDGEIYVGEQTFYHCSGFAEVHPKEWNYQMGDWINAGGGQASVLKVLPRRKDKVELSNKDTYNKINGGLRDYKLYCFDGKVKLYLVTTDRSKGATTGDYFDEQNRHLDLIWGFPNAKTIPDVPNNIEKMKELAEILAAGIPQLRVDFYCIHDKVYFGELTFFDGSGFDEIEQECYRNLLGDYIKLPTLV